MRERARFRPRVGRAERVLLSAVLLLGGALCRPDGARADTAAAPGSSPTRGDVAAAGGAGAALPSAADFDAAASAARDLLGRLVAADTSNPPGNEARAVAIGAERLRAASIPFRVSEFAPGRENLIARLAGAGAKRPLLLLAHVDVVGADGQAWSTDPHRMVEVDGFLVGRGVLDDLGMAAVALEVVSLLHRNAVPLRRDVILAWTGDEESGGSGIRWQLEHDPASLDAEIALNEGGQPVLDASGRVQFVEMQAAEKLYQDFTIVAEGPTGHSSVPMPDNPIDRIARALARLAAHRFPARLLPVTRAWLAGRAPLETPERGAAMRALAAATGTLPEAALARLEEDPILAATLRTTCVATMIEGGTRVNALPARASANVNCRILPDETSADVQRQLAAIFDDPSLAITPMREFGHAPASALDGAGPDAIRAASAAMWPGATIVPFMGRGASDSRHLRGRGVASYGISPIAVAESESRRAHGIDERIPAASLRPAVEFLYRLVLELAT